MGHMHHIPPPNEHDHNGFSLPHNPVLKPESTTSPVHVVFNASHVSATGRSLNDVLYTGPAHQADLTTILFRSNFTFRMTTPELHSSFSDESLSNEFDAVSIDISMRSSPAPSLESQCTVKHCEKECDPPAKLAAQVARVLPRSFCYLCRKGHPLRHCHKFQRMSMELRLRTVAKYGYCGRCLAHDHHSIACKSKDRCHKCHNREHNTLLHFDESAGTPRRSERSSEAPSRRSHGMLSASARQSLLPTTATRVRSIVLMPTCVFFIYFQGQRLRTRALLDSCSDSSRLSLAGLHALGLSNVRSSVDEMVDVVVSSLYRSDARMTLAVTLVANLDIRTPAAPVSAAVCEEVFHLKLADEGFGVPGAIHMTLGGDVCHELMRPRIMKLPGVPTAQDSFFGWVLSGPCHL